MPEKASSLVIAAQFPELEDQGVADRIQELEKEYGKNDERVAFEIGKEIAEGKFYDFEELERACDAGIRVGVSYMTGGITTAPLEGIGDIKIRENSDGTEYIAVYYSGPIRSAGGTASAMSVLLADYVRKNVGLDEFKPSETVVKRYAAEVDDYYNRVTAKQYEPERQETEFIADHVPIEVTGSPTESLEVTNYKDLDRVETNKIRGGMCLVYLDGLPLKAPKIKKRIEKWGAEFGLEHWSWVKEYLELQEELHSSGDESNGEEEAKYTPSDKYLGSLTAGRPVFAHPGRKGGFRLRYGHSRTNGLAATSFHPATMEITERFVAIGTQLKTEYPGKATIGTPCDSIAPPVVRMEDGSVRKIDTRDEARKLEDDIDQILFLGDILVPFGEFVENGKKLLPSPYVDEWWEKELEKELEEREMKLGRDFTDRTPTPEEAFKISEAVEIPLHPEWTHHWKETTPERFNALRNALAENNISADTEAKKCLEDILAEHEVKAGVVEIEENQLKVIKNLLQPKKEVNYKINDADQIPEVIEQISGFKVGDQAPHYIGGRMGRPEKAERRTIKGKPQLLFPCGKKEGGRMRNLAASYDNTVNGQKGIVKQSIIHNRCPECGDHSFFSYCQDCDVATTKIWFCRDCGKEHDEEVQQCGSCGGEYLSRYKRAEINVKEMLDEAMENVGVDRKPELLKSVRGMSAKHKHVEPIEKGLLRNKHDLYVNKDGTVRYDASDLPMSHFKPHEISVSVEKLREMGYEEDVNGDPLEDDDQVCALKPQDIVIPDGENTMAASDYFVRVANFVDDLLEQFYGLESYYDVETKEDLVGTLVIGLAPHTSGGTVGRIIGFTDAKGIYAHPYWHAGKRRNCLPGDTEVKLADGESASLEELYSEGADERKADAVGTYEKSISKNVESVKEGEVLVNEAVKIYKTMAPENKIRFYLDEEQYIDVFPNHTLETPAGTKKALSLEEGDRLLSLESSKQVVKKEIKQKKLMESGQKYMYDIEVDETHRFVTGEGVIHHNCDGDEDAILLLMDGLLNFSRQFLPDMTGARSVTKDTRLFTKINGEFRVKTAEELIDSVLDNEGFQTREDGFEVNRDFEDDIQAVSFDKEGDVKLEEVTALIRHKNDKKVFELKTSRGQISVTEDHSVFVTEGKDIEARPVREIEKGDCIVVPSNFDLDFDTIEDKIDLFELMPDEECYVEVPDDELKQIKPKIEENINPEIINQYGKNNIYRYKTGRRTANLEFYKNLGVVPSCKVSLASNADPIERYFERNEYLFRLLGYLMSEGNIESGRIYNNDKEVISDIQSCIENLTGVRKQANTDSRDDREDNYWVRIPATFRRALEELGLKSLKAENKVIPSFVLGAERELKEEFLKAYRAGDGSIYEEKGFSKLYTKSGEMASQLSYLVRNLGFKSSTRTAGDTWEILYSDWTEKDPYWPLWEIKDSVRDSLREDGLDNKEVKAWMANYRKNNRMKTTGKEKIETLFEKGVEELHPVANGSISVERVVGKNQIDYGDDYVYDLEVPNDQNFLCGPHPIFAHNTMDAPLILSTVLNPDEIDDEAWAIETVSEYPLQFYEETQNYTKPWELECDIEIGEDVVYGDDPFNHGYTHETTSIDNGPNQSEYVTLDDMAEKTGAQLTLGRKIMAVDENATAELLLKKHFIPDIKGNLRSFSSQKMRCVDCNEKFRRVPLSSQTIAPTGKTTAKCPECEGKVLLTISEGTIKKYLLPSEEIIDEYEISPYVRQQIFILKQTLQSLFGKENRQSGLKQFT